MAKIKCIVKRPDETYRHVANISDTLRNLQNTVEGQIEICRLPEGIVIICNEEGKILDLPHNFNIKYITGKTGETMYEEIVGTVIVCGVAGEEFCDIPISFAKWKELLNKWNN